MAKITTVSHVPDELVEAWLQHLRDFDAAHDGCHFEVKATTELSTEDMMKAVGSVSPEFDFMMKLDRKTS